MPNAAVVECYATLVEAFNTLRSDGSRHRGADYKRSAGQPVVAYEECTVVDSDLYSSYIGYSVVARRKRDGKYIGWAHLRKGTRPNNGTVLKAGDQVGLVAGWGDSPGSSWSGPHIHTTEGDTAQHIYYGQNTDPVPDITAAKSGTAGGGATPVVNYHWREMSKAAMLALQKVLNKRKIYGGVAGGTGPEDGDFGPNSVKGVQKLYIDLGYLPGDYDIDGVPHNLDQEAPSNYGFAMQKFADRAGYSKVGKMDGLPGPLTSEYVVKAAEALLSPTTPTPDPTPKPTPIPVLPPAGEGFIFMPDLGTSQSAFDFAEYTAAGGNWVALKMGGGNASDSPYTAPAYVDQWTRAIAKGCRIVHYWFNGRKNGVTPESSADYFAANSKFKPGDVVAIDVEDETDTATTHWTPAEAVRFALRLQVHYPGVKGLIYASDSVLDRDDWAPLKALGWEAWNASWGANTGDPSGTPPTSDEFTETMVWQYTSKEKVPGNYTKRSDGTKVYGDTDGNIARADLFDKLGWVKPTLPDPEEPTDPTPTPIPDTVEKMLLQMQGQLAVLGAAVEAVPNKVWEPVRTGA